jgi:signal transduction histidine kinase
MAAESSRGFSAGTPSPPSANGEELARKRAARPAFDDRLSEAQREHQVKTALAVIYGFSSTLEERWDDIPDPARRDAVAVIGRRTLDLMDQTERLLEDAKRDAAGRSRAVSHIDVAALVRESAETWDGVSDAPVVVAGPKGAVHAWADGDALRQVLGHLVDNALKYSPDGGSVTLQVKPRDRWVEITVADEGIGLPRDVNVFAPFQQADDGTPEADGVGLGLHVARNVVEAMGGSLTARRNSSGGSTFVVGLRRLTGPPLG